MRLGDLNIYSPKCAADWRVSVNLEIPGELEVCLFFSPRLPAILLVCCQAFLFLIDFYAVSHPLGSATHTRRKDRMSYSHEEFIIDLTQVTATASAATPVCFSFF